jgi:hypothetical protein
LQLSRPADTVATVREEAISAIGTRSLAIDVYIWPAYRLHALAKSTVTPLWVVAGAGRLGGVLLGERDAEIEDAASVEPMRIGKRTMKAVVHRRFLDASLRHGDLPRKRRPVISKSDRRARVTTLR